MTRDRLTLLHTIRPQITLDAAWTPQEQRAIQERILADPAALAEQPRRRRRVTALVAALGVGALALPGVAAAVGNGMRTQAFFEAYNYWHDDPQGVVDPSTVVRAATAPGPHGANLSIVTARTSDGRICLAPIIESSTSSDDPVPTYFEDGGSFCIDRPSTAPFGGTELTRTETAALWWAHAGDAVTAELRMPTGETYPTVLVDGYLFGWYPLPLRGPDDAPTIIGYAADGTEIGRTAP